MTRARGSSRARGRASRCATTPATIPPARPKARAADAAVVVVADTAGEGDKPCLALDCGAAPGLQRDELIERRGGGQRPHDRRARDRRAGAHALAPPGQGHRRGLVPRQRRRRGDRPGAVRGRRPGRPPTGELPGACATCPRPAAVALPRSRGQGALRRGRAGRLPLVRAAQPPAAFPFGHGLSYGRFSFEGCA